MDLPCSLLPQKCVGEAGQGQHFPGMHNSRSIICSISVEISKPVCGVGEPGSSPFPNPVCTHSWTGSALLPAPSLGMQDHMHSSQSPEQMHGICFLSS